MSETPEPAGMVWTRMRLHFVRALRCDFTRMEATDEERAALAAAGRPVTDARAQDYFAWRRSMGIVALIFGGVAILIAFIEFVDSLNELARNEYITNAASLIVMLFFAGQLALGIGLVVAVRGWTDTDRSQRALFWGWAIAVFVPLMVILLPLADMMFDWTKVAQTEGGGAAQLGRAVLETIIAVAMFWTAVPSLLALFPGLLRGALTVKTLVPARGAGPVVAACIAPIYAVFFVTVFGQLQQLSGSIVMGFGILLLAAAPIVYVWRCRYLMPPLDPERTRRQVAVARNRARVLSGVGLLLVFITLFSTKILGVPLVGWDADEAMVGVFAFVKILIWFVAMLTTYTVVSSDGLLRAMRASDENLRSWAETGDRERDAGIVVAVGEALARPAPAADASGDAEPS